VKRLKIGEKMMNEVRIIKRYQNRKLYDTHQSCYVTLEEISQIIREGHEIQVIDNKTKNDITYMTQIQLLFDQEKKSTRVGDVELLKRVIRATEGTFTGYIRGLEAKMNGEEVVTTTEEFKPFMAADTTTATETTTTLN
jgi:polyhydroxyalkanoate synthesis repressor PhaR